MNKTKYIILPLLLVLVGGGCSQGLAEDQQVEYEDVQELIEEVSQDYEVQGSCNVIDSGSTCFDYIGSLWKAEFQMQLNCQDVGTFSYNTCPYSENGGCRSMPGSVGEIIAWSYPYGGQPITGDALVAQIATCNSLEVAEWVTPGQVFLNPTPSLTD